MDAHVSDWAALALRWLHVTAGMAWIGISIHHLRQAREPSLERYQVRWEAYLTWASGFLLLVLLYYAWAENSLVDPQVLEISGGAAIALGLCLLTGVWIAYDQLCKSALARHERALGVALLALLALSAWGMTQLFSGRGAFIHFGAILGTVMTANVAHVVVPALREARRAQERGEPPDPQRLAAARQRDAHNTYLVLPVILAMIAGHHPVAFAHRANGLVLAALALAGVGLRALFVRQAQRR